MRKALSACGCASADAADQAWAQRETLEREVNDAAIELARLAPGDAATGLAAGAGPLRDHVEITRRRVRQEREALGLAELPSEADASAGVRASADEETAAAEAVAAARAYLDVAASRHADARTTLATLEAEAVAKASVQAKLLAEQDAAERAEAGEVLAQRVAAANAAKASRVADLAACERDRPEDTPDGMQARIDRYEKALENRQKTVRGLREEIAGLRARIAQEGGAGLDEQLALAERERDALGQELAGFEREGQVLRLLIDTLATAERAAKERYLAPVVRRVAPYLGKLFPGADIACDDRLRITGITRRDLGAEEFDRLSDGTQEQVAVLARLAFAELLVDQGKPAMVILDDALAYSDGERLERMFDILTEASTKTQILILTCRDDLFGRLGGSRLALSRAAAEVGA